jgi:hypothetical protein
MTRPPVLASLALQVPDLMIEPSGVKPFFYPVLPRQTTQVLLSFVDAFHEHLRESPPKPGSTSEALWMMFPILCLDVIQAFHGGALLRRCAAAGYRPRGTFFDALAEGRMPDPSRRLSIGLQRPPHIPIWRSLARRARSLMPQYGELEHLSSFKPLAVGRPMLFHVSALVAKYAKEQGEQPLLSYPEDWLMPGSRISGASPDLSSILDPMVRRAFAAGEEEPSAALSAWLIRSAELCCMWGSSQISHLRKRRNVPQRFWAGTLGNPVYRVMSTVVRERGGEVTGFDHGMSTGLWDTPIQTLLEFDFVDRFVTFTKAMADGLCANWQSPQSIHGRLPELVFLQSAVHTAEIVPTPRAHKRLRKVIYVPTLYSGDAVHLIPFYSDVQMVSWQARLLSFLRDQEFDVSIKPHPESVHALPAELAALVDGRVLAGRFEDLDLADAILLFDYPQTTAFVHAVRSENPIVVIDFDRLDIRPEARPLFEARCALVKGAAGVDGRLDIYWPALINGLDVAPQRMDSALVERYFP